MRYFHALSSQFGRDSRELYKNSNKKLRTVLDRFVSSSTACTRPEGRCRDACGTTRESGVRGRKARTHSAGPGDETRKSVKTLFYSLRSF